MNLGIIEEQRRGLALGLFALVFTVTAFASSAQPRVTLVVGGKSVENGQIQGSLLLFPPPSGRHYELLEGSEPVGVVLELDSGNIVVLNRLPSTAETSAVELDLETGSSKELARWPLQVHDVLLHLRNVGALALVAESHLPAERERRIWLFADGQPEQMLRPVGADLASSELPGCWYFLDRYRGVVSMRAHKEAPQIIFTLPPSITHSYTLKGARYAVISHEEIVLNLLSKDRGRRDLILLPSGRSNDFAVLASFETTLGEVRLSPPFIDYRRRKVFVVEQAKKETLLHGYALNNRDEDSWHLAKDEDLGRFVGGSASVGEYEFIGVFDGITPAGAQTQASVVFARADGSLWRHATPQGLIPTFVQILDGDNQHSQCEQLP